MNHLWIVHRDAQTRRALRRLAGAVTCLEGDPGDPRFEDAAAPGAVLLGAQDDFEPELEFAHRFLERAGEAVWLILAEPGDIAEARRLFDGIGAEMLPYPAGAAEIARRLRALPRRRDAAPIAERRLRDRLAARFARWFGDLELPELLRALDPKLADVPLLVRGEPGTGRLLLARYVHLFGAHPVGPFVVVPCSPGVRAADLLERLCQAPRPTPGAAGLCACFEDLDRLAPGEQRELGRWIELGGPPGASLPWRIRWMATLGEASGGAAALDPVLEATLSGLDVRIPALRERPGAIVSFAESTVEAWCRTRGERRRELHPETTAILLEHPWPANLRELEAVLARSLAAEASDPLPASALRFVAEGPAAPSPEPPPAVEPWSMDAFELDRESSVETLGPVGLPEEPPEEPEPDYAPEHEEEAAADAELEAETELEPDAASSEESVRGLTAALARELRAPVEELRRLAEMLPAHGDEPGFRTRLAEAVELDSGQLAALLERLARFADLEPPRPERVNLAELLDGLLESHRGTIERRRLLMLKELDREQPFARVDGEQIRFAFDGLLTGVLTRVPERGDLYLSSKHHPEGPAGRPAVRVLLRFHNPPEPIASPDAMVELALAAAIVRRQGGHVAVDRVSGEESLVLFDLPA